jgi:hypothetical protein
MTKKIYNIIALRAWGGQRLCELNDDASLTASRALGRCRFGEDNCAMGPKTARVDGVMGSGTVPGAQCRGLVEDNVVAGSRTVSQAWGRACVVDGITDSGRGRWRCVKGLNCGREQWRGGSGEDSMMLQRLQGGLDDGTGFGEADDSLGSREIFGGKFW